MNKRATSVAAPIHAASDRPVHQVAVRGTGVGTVVAVGAAGGVGTVAVTDGSSVGSGVGTVAVATSGVPALAGVSVKVGNGIVGLRVAVEQPITPVEAIADTKVRSARRVHF